MAKGLPDLEFKRVRDGDTDQLPPGKGGCQRGTKLCWLSSVHRQPKAVLTTHSSSPAQASSCAWISPVK